jgi:SAM-dependent methyltransferase
MQNYFIKEGYRTNLSPDGERIEQYKAIPDNAPYQVACYQYAAQLIRKKGYRSCLELGSGSGYKLDKYIKPYAERIVGIDLPHAVEHCREVYPSIEWISDDFDSPTAALQEAFDIIISFDVIEHLINPEQLLRKIRQYATRETSILISTPERDLLNGQNHSGPPRNKLHVREWNQVELRQFLLNEGFVINRLLILDARILTFRQRISQLLGRVNYKTCQLYECSIQ